jgi:hypothetical protein
MRAAALTALLAGLLASAFAACSSEESTIAGPTSPTHNPNTPSDSGTAGSDARGGVVDSGTPPPQKPGSSSLTVSNDAPPSGDGTMTVDSVVAENAGGDQSDRTRVTVLGSTGDGKKHKLLIYFFVDNGQMSSVTHWWGDNVTDAFQTDGIAYCDALPGGEPPQCQGLYHDPTQRFITFTGTLLHGKFQGGSTSDPTASTIDGALLYPAY